MCSFKKNELKKDKSCKISLIQYLDKKIEVTKLWVRMGGEWGKWSTRSDLSIVVEGLGHLIDDVGIVTSFIQAERLALL